MMNYKGWAIPEGNVVKVEDAAGNVLWSAVKKAVITIEGSGSTYAYVVINGVQYNGATTVEVPIGSVITCVTDCQEGYQITSKIRVNYQTAASGVKATYDYTVVSDATITISTKIVGSYAPYSYGNIEIVDANMPNGAMVTITNGGVTSGPGTGQVIIDGETYRDATMVLVPFGTVIVCSCSWTSHQMYGSYGGQIKLNGTLVADRVTGVNPTTYEYTANRDVQVDLVGVGSPGGVVTNINITEL